MGLTALCSEFTSQDSQERYGNVLAPTKVLDCRSLVLFLAIICWGRMCALNGFPYPIFLPCKHTSCISWEPWSTGYCHWYVSLSCLLCVSHLTGMFNSPPCHVFLESSYLDRSQRDAGQTRTLRVIFQDISILRERHWGAGLSFITNK